MMRNGSDVADRQAVSLGWRVGMVRRAGGQDLACPDPLFRRAAAQAQPRLPAPFDGQIRPGPLERPAQDQPFPILERKAQGELKEMSGRIGHDDLRLHRGAGQRQGQGPSA